MRRLVEARGLKKVYPLKKGLWGRSAAIWALRGVDLALTKGETFGLVGESGCGKSTLGRLLVRLEEPSEGRVFFDGQDVMELKGEGLKAFRRRAQIIFQDPYNSLNPRKRVEEILSEPFEIHSLLPRRSERQEVVKELLYKVGLPLDSLGRYPHEFSGGQRQRIVIARAIALRPEFIVADEPLSALDVSVQAQILKLFLQLQEELALTYLFISHDISVVSYLADRVGVMYLGTMVEVGPKDEVFSHPLHPYTQGLLKAVPTLERKRRIRPPFPGDPQGEFPEDHGCPFLPRCPKAQGRCKQEVPSLREVAPGHWVSCVLYDS